MTMSSPLSPYLYTVGGPLQPNAPSYVVRPVDHELEMALKGEGCCGVFAPGQMGKTSLRLRVMDRLQREGYACVALELMKMGCEDSTSQQWYGGIMQQLVRQLGVEMALGVWLRDRAFLSPVQQFSELLETLIFPTLQAPIVLLIDDVERLGTLQFSPNDFFAVLRGCWESGTIRVALFGDTLAPDGFDRSGRALLTQCGSRLTPGGFALAATQPLWQGLREHVPDPEAMMALILDWTGGQPFLTQKLCALIVQAPQAPPADGQGAWLTQLITTQLLDPWESYDEPPHLRLICDRLLAPGPNLLPRLQGYQAVVTGQGDAVERSAVQQELQALGLIRVESGRARVANRIYQAVFSAVWVQDAIATLQPDFINLVLEQEHKLLTVLKGQTGQDFEDLLGSILGTLILNLGEMLAADHVNLFFLNQETDELWSILTQTTVSHSTKIQLFAETATPERVMIYKKAVHVSRTTANDWGVIVANVQSQTALFRNELTLPLRDETGEIVAFIQVMNKLKVPSRPELPLVERIDLNGFTERDRDRLNAAAPALHRMLKRCQDCYSFTQRLHISEAIAEATRTVAHSSLNTQDIIRRVMAAAKRLMNADRSTLWLLDDRNDQLWTEIPFSDGSVHTIRIPVSQGFAGQVAATGQPLNIPYDLYDHPDSIIAQQTDQQTGYRTCSLLCLPVWSPDGELLGVTQLVNKRRPGAQEPYDARNWPAAPYAFQASFDRNSQQYLKIFNTQVGIALHNARQLEQVQRQAQPRSDNAVRQTLDLLNQVMDGNGFDDILDTTLRSITLRVGRALNADRTTIFLLDEENQEFWSILAEADGTNDLEIRIPADQGIVGETARCRQILNIPYDFYDDPRSAIAQVQDRKNNYRTYTLVAVPLLNEQGNLIAVVQCLNKLQRFHDRTAPLAQRIDPAGFTAADITRFLDNTPLMRMILESFRAYHRTAKQQRIAAALMAATRSVSQGKLTIDGVIHQVMTAAQDLLNADRSTLWLLDRDRQELWTKITSINGTTRELRLKLGEGYAGWVAQHTLPVNIPYDLYDHPQSATAKTIDRCTGYRTCSLLCLPVWNPQGELIAVTQLVNKIRPNLHRQEPTPPNGIPDYLHTGFDAHDQRYMQVFNRQVGVILDNAERLTAQRDRTPQPR
jgi:GAF domain-containing protein